MSPDVEQLLSEVEPVAFTDGTSVFRDFMEQYVVHTKGFFICAPSGSGKTYFVNHQEERHWIDGDELWIAAGAHPDREWWKDSTEVVYAIDQRSDVITEQARRLGLWIIGASNYWLVPDAIVLPDWDTHLRYIGERETNNYDGGATQEDLQSVLDHRKWLVKLAENEGVPVFPSAQEAAAFLAGSLERSLALDQSF